VREDRDALEQHLLGVGSPVVAGLAEHGHRLGRRCRLERRREDVRPRGSPGGRGGIEQRLRDPVPDCGVERVAVAVGRRQRLDRCDVVRERFRIPANEFVRDRSRNYITVRLRPEERIAPPGTGVLDRRAVPDSDRAVA